MFGKLFQQPSLSFIYLDMIKKTCFPKQLHRLLENLARTGREDIACWSAEGMAFRINDRREFESLLGRYETRGRGFCFLCIANTFTFSWFRQSKYASFQRQLCAYGFERVKTDKGSSIFRHAQFVRSRPELTLQMERQKDRRLSTQERMEIRNGLTRGHELVQPKRTEPTPSADLEILARMLQAALNTPPPPPPPPPPQPTQINPVAILQVLAQQLVPPPPPPPSPPPPPVSLFGLAAATTRLTPPSTLSQNVTNILLQLNSERLLQNLLANNNNNK